MIKHIKYRYKSMIICFLIIIFGCSNYHSIHAQKYVPIESGLYNIPVSLLNATKENMSMGNGALHQVGKLVVTEDGMSLYLKLNPLNLYGMTGYLMEFNLLENITFNQQKYPETYTKKEATIVTTYDVVDSYNSVTSSDDKCAGRQYPSVIKIPIEPTVNQYWIEIYVPVMGSLGLGEQACRLKLDYDAITPMSSEEEKNWLAYEGQQQEEVNPDKSSLEDGKYQVKVDLWNATTDKESMGNAALNHTALLTVKDGVYSIELSTRPMSVGTITACLQKIFIMQKDGSYVEAAIIARNNEGNQPSVFQFVLPMLEEYFYVKIDPQVQVMGTEPIEARLKVDWDSIKVVEDSTVIEENNEMVGVGLQSPSVTLTDKNTGLVLKAKKNILPTGVILQCEKLTKENLEDEILEIIEQLGRDFVLYRIVLTDSQGNEVQPVGMVELEISTPSAYKKEAVKIYRISDKKKTAMSGELNNTKYTFSTNYIGDFAVVDTSTEVIEIEDTTQDNSGTTIRPSTGDTLNEESKNPVPEGNAVTQNQSTQNQATQSYTIIREVVRNITDQGIWVSIIVCIVSVFTSILVVSKLATFVLKDLLRRLRKNYVEN